MQSEAKTQTTAHGWARSARKMIQWIIFSEGGPAGPGSAKQPSRCAWRTAENSQIFAKMSKLIFRKIWLFSYARELSLRHLSYRRKLFVFSLSRIARMGPGGEVPWRRARDRGGLERLLPLLNSSMFFKL